MGTGAFPQDRDNYTGMLGMHGTHTSNQAINDCDLLIAIGARFSDRVISKVSTFAKNARIIHIDIDEKEFGKNIDVDLTIKGDIKNIFRKVEFKYKKPESQ